MRVTGADQWIIKIKIVTIVHLANDPNIWMVQLEIMAVVAVQVPLSQIQGHKNDTVTFHLDLKDASKQKEEKKRKTNKHFRLTHIEVKDIHFSLKFTIFQNTYTKNKF